jgi:hypothetical protein
LAKLFERAAVQGPQPALFGGRKLGRDPQRAQVSERFADAHQLGLELYGTGRQDRVVRLLCAQLFDRCTQQLLAVMLVGCLIRTYQPERFTGAQAVLVDALHEGLLVIVGQRRQRVRQCRTDRARREPLLGAGR